MGETNLELKLSEGRSYSRSEVLKSSLDYFNGDELAATTWMKKYARRSNGGDVYLESNPDDMHRRMAKEFARVEQHYSSSELPLEKRQELSEYGQRREPLTEEKIFSLFKDFKYVVPQGSVMASLGVPGSLSSLSNCVVIPEIYDSYGGIMEADQQLAQLFKRRCGVGADLSTLRPAQADVANSAGITSGAVSFAPRFSNTTREVAQDGRRGALMLTMDIGHPDVEDFIVMKQDLKSVTGANVSVKIRDEFMRAVMEDGIYTHKWPIGSNSPKFTKDVRASELWNTLITCAHNTAEPGLIFWDRQHWYSPSSVYPGHENICTNPCSEIAMPNDSCRLMAENLYGFVEDPFTPNARFNHEKFFEVTYESQRLMDGLVDLELEAIGRIREKIRDDPEPTYIKEAELRIWNVLYDMGKKARRTGLGFTGLGDTLAALGHKFDSDEGMGELEKIMRTKCEAEFESSIDMAIERGAFDDFNPVYENKSEFVQMIQKEFPQTYERMMKHGRRNISLSTVAPTGTLSMLTQTTAGIEPALAIERIRRRKVNPNEKDTNIVFVDELGDSWEEFSEYHHGVKTWQEVTGKSLNDPSNPYIGSTAPEIDWMKRLEIQAIVQKYTTHSISSTINLPADVSVEKVGEIYKEAWRKGLKGITVYREGSRNDVVRKKESDLENKVSLVQNSVKPHPVLDIKSQAIKYKIKRPDNGDSLHIILASDLYVDDKTKKAFFIPDEDFQVRAPLGVATSVSFAQSGMDRTEILRGPNPDYAEFVSRLQSASSNEEEGIGPRKIRSIEHAAGLAFEDYFSRNGIIGRDSETNKLTNLVRKGDLRKVEKDSEEYKAIISQVRVADSGEEIEISGNNGKRSMKNCPKCDAELVFEEGCVKCLSCGDFNKCG